MIHCIVHIRHHTGVGSKWCHGIIPAIQTNFMSVGSPSEVTIWTDTETRDYGTIREGPVPQRTSIRIIYPFATVSVDIGSVAHKRRSRISRFSCPNISDEYSVTREIHNTIQGEVQSCAGSCRT